MAKNALAKKGPTEEEEKKPATTALVTTAEAALPALVSDMEMESGQGFEEADKDAFQVPIVKVLQKMSKEVDETEGVYMEGAKPGMFLNTATRELYGYSIDAVAVHYQRRFNRWKDLDAGGGFLGSFAPEDPVVTTAKRDPDGPSKLPVDESGNIVPEEKLVDTRNHYIIIRKKDGSFDLAVFPLKSTHLKRSRQWMTQMKSLKMKRSDGGAFTPPMFAFTWQIGPCVVEKNEKGSWHSPVFQNPRPLDDANVYQAAKGFREIILSGKAEIQQVEDDDLGTGGSVGGEDGDDGPEI